MRKLGRGLALGIGMLALTAVPLTATRAAEMQIRFDVPEPFRIAGQAFQAGVVTIHRVTSFTPTTTLLEVWVGGTCLGMITARTVGAEEPAVRDEAFFRRGADGLLEMIGYRLTGTSAYAFGAR